VRIRKKLIEVALPLDAINEASAKEKSIRHGHPSTLHMWWARRPLAAARAVIFSQMIDDPSEYVDVLLADGKKKRKAESVLKARIKLWEEAKDTAEKAARGGIEAQVAAPGPRPELREVVAELERERLFAIVRKLVRWESTTNEEVLQEARDEVWQSWRRTCAENADHPRAKELFDRHKLPAFHDPFAGGGALPLEAQRLGLDAHASDLNPVAVLINKAMIEIPPRFAGRPPVNPAARKKLDHSGSWRGAQGLAEDVRYYGNWMRDEAERRIGFLYPKIEVTPAMVRERSDLKQYLGEQLTVIAWIWARTVKSPNPAFANIDVPLASTFLLGMKPGKESYVEPVIASDGYRFTVKVGKPTDAEAVKKGTKLSQGSFKCLMSGTPFRYEYIDDEANAGRMGERLMALVAEGQRSRVYLSPTADMEALARSADPAYKPDAPSRGTWASNAQGRIYGFRTFGEYFTPRQLTALTTFSDLVQIARERVKSDALTAGLSGDPTPLDDGGTGATAYGDAVATYLGLAVARYSNASSSLCSWNPGQKKEDIRFTFSRQGIAMTWDYAEGNPFSDSSGNFADNFATWLYKALLFLPLNPGDRGESLQADAASQTISRGKIVSTDPPYYDNIGYADLSDFFYVWQRRALKPIFPSLFATLAVPKTEELVATPYRHGSKEKAEAFFLDGMTAAMHGLAEQAHPAFPITIYYAFKQSESDDDDGTASTGWDTFLEAVIKAGLAISGTWPIRTEREGRSTGIGTNALASSIVLVCRRRLADAPIATRREFVAALKSELPGALSNLQRGNIAPVDLAQAAIGPGMAVFTRYAKVLDAEGKQLSVRQALTLINAVLDESLAQQEGDFDPESRWAVTWLDNHGFEPGPSGEAILLSTARGTALNALEHAGLIESKAGKVRLLRPAELPKHWNPATDPRLTAWEIVHHLIRVFEEGGETSAATMASQLGVKAEVGRELAYRLFNICDRRKRAAEALSYNALVQSWPEIMRLARESRESGETQSGLFT
jgi:putative DNA methylase